MDTFNHGPAGLVVVLPITTKNVSLHVKVIPPEAGLTEVSFIKCEDVRSISTTLLLQRLGDIAVSTLVAVEQRLRILMRL
jgi:mRNA interferase MazF